MIKKRQNVALKPGFERYEGLAYFGFEPEGDGIDAVVIIGKNVIEIRNERDEVLSMWAPHSYHCNEQNLPLRAYFSGNEWLAPKDRELADFLDIYTGADEPDASEVKRSLRLKIAIIGSGVLVAIALFAFLIFRSAFDRLIDENIAQRIDALLLEDEIEELWACNQETEPLLKEFVQEKAGGQDYMIVQKLNSAFAILPSGVLAIDEVFAKRLESEEPLVALLQLANAHRQSDNPAKRLVKLMSLREQFEFLRTGSLDSEALKRVWPQYSELVQIRAEDYENIEKPLGNFAMLRELGVLNSESGVLPIIPSGLDFGARDWDTLITMCKMPS